MKYARVFLLFLFTLALTLSAQAQEQRGMQVVPKNHRYALLIGINDYNKPFEPLKYCDADMEALEKVLLELDFPPENIVRLSTSATNASRLPTKTNILHQAKLLADEVDENGLFILAFSGYGASYGDESFFCPMDMVSKDLNSLVKRTDVYKIVEDCPAKQKLVFVDACRSSLGIEGWKAAGGMKGPVDPVGIENPGFFIISSCRTGQFSWDDKKLGHSVFMHFLVEGLQGKAAQDGYISVYGLFSYVNLQTKRYVRLNFEDSQSPILHGNGDEMDDFLIAKIEEKPQLQAGVRKVLMVDGIEYAFRWCPPGEFVMGSPPSEERHGDDEIQHRVVLTRGFWLLETEVTQAMWQSVMRENPSWFKGRRYPVECVTWDECQEFCKRLSQKLGQEVKLPTEAQWEYACRAGTTGVYAGDLNAMAWYNEDWHRGSSHPVAKKKPNPWGLYDMHGNVWEWCSDYCDAKYYGRSPTNDPENTDVSELRVFRGGCWHYMAEDCRSACRDGGEPDEYRHYDLGLRILLVPSQED